MSDSQGKSSHTPGGYGFVHPGDEAFPPIVMVDLTNVCNGRCVHCPQNDFKGREEYRPAFLDPGLFEKLMKEVSPHEPEVVSRMYCTTCHSDAHHQ